MGKQRFNFHNYLVVQISIFVTVVSILGITYLSSYLAHQQAEAASKQLKQQAVVVADNIAAATSSYVITRNYTSIEEILAKAIQYEGIVSMQVLDMDNNTLSNVVKSESGEIKPVFVSMDYNLPSVNELTINQSNDNMEIFSPIILGDLVGWVRIVYALDAINRVREDIWINSLASGFIITIVTVTILILLLRKPVVSIRKYTDFADKLNEFNGDSIKVDKQSVELHRLGVALNSVSANLYEHHGKLKETLGDVERVAAIVEQSPDIVLSIGLNNSIEYINTAGRNSIKNIFSSDNDKNILKLMPENKDELLQRCIQENISLSNIESSCQGHTYSWKFTPFSSWRFSPLVKHDVVHCHAVDITDIKQAEEKLVYQANYDSLTGLPNRVLALDRLKQSLKISQRIGSNVGVLFLDVERFQVVIDTFGHGSGDLIINEVSERLGNCIRDSDTLARFSNNEFLIILNNVKQTLDCNIVAEKAIKIMTNSFAVGDKKIHLGLSVGITSYPDDDTDATNLVRNSDIAMHKAKEKGGNTYQFYSSEFNEQALHRVEMESELRNALEKNELFLVYQPQIDIQNNRIIGAEALIRWVNDKLGFVPPDRFISMAEDTGLIIPIGAWVLKTACEEAKKWSDSIGQPLRVAVNVSARQFVNSDFPATVKNILDETGLPANYLELEITESLLVDDASGVIACINQLKEIGVTLALDDFGTGYSSLSYLKRFPFDILKIDRSFVNDVVDNMDDASLCKAIVAIASSLKLNVIGEGVETKEQLDFLRAIGADIVQGYFYSKPLEVPLFVDYVNQFND